MTAITVHPDGLLTWPGGSLPSVLGRGGIKLDKREGDGATPVGCFPLRRVLWRADRLPMPRTGLPLQAIEPDDGWCDDPADPAYNRPVKRPYAASHEALWREDGVYDVIVVMGHNDDPVAPGLGSAVFFHVARPDRSPTEGCVALPLDDLLRVLAVCGPESSLTVLAAQPGVGPGPGPGTGAG